MDTLLDNMFPALRRRRPAGAGQDAAPPGGPAQQPGGAGPQPGAGPPPGAAPPPQQPPPRAAGAQNAAEEQFVAIRDRLFHAMFVRLSLGYARLFNARVRRVVEFASLLVVRTHCIPFVPRAGEFGEPYYSPRAPDA